MEMQMEYIRKLPEPQELMEQFPIDDKVKAIKAKRDEEIKDILTGKDNRFLLIIGPCSADNEPSSIISTAWSKSRNRSKIKFSSFRASIPANRVLSASATKACSTSPTRKARKTCWAASSPSVK